MPGLLLRGGRPWGLDAPADVLIREGVIERIGPDLQADPVVEVVDVPGRLLLPGLIDAHCHVDKTLFGGRWVPHSAGPALADRIAEERRRRAELGLPNVEHMTALLEQMVVSGTTHVRTHTDVVTDHGLAGVEAVRAAQDQGDRTRRPRRGQPRVRPGTGRPGHPGPARPATGRCRVSLVTAAVYNFPVPPIARLRAAGVTIACGHDGIRDLWSPFGSGDMLERAMHLAYRSTFRRDEEIEMALEAATYGGARALGLEAYGLEPGARADIVVIDASTPAEAVVAHPVRDLVVKAGRIVARQGVLVG